MDGTVRIWDPATGHPIGEPLTGHAGSVMGVCAVPRVDESGHPDGRAWLASLGNDGTLRIWDPATGRPVRKPLTGHVGARTGVCTVPGIDPSGHPHGRTWLAAFGDNGTIRIWDPVTGCPAGETLTGHSNQMEQLCAVHGSDRTGHRNERAWIASGGNDGAVRVWDPVTGSLVGPPLIGHLGPAYGVCTVPAVGGAGRPDERAWLASAGGDGTVRVWDPAAGRPVGEPLSPSLAAVAALQPVQPSEGACAVVHSAGHLELWDPATATLTRIDTPIGHVTAYSELSQVRRWVVADTTGRLALLVPGQNGSANTTALGDDVLCLLPIPGQPCQLACAHGNGTINLVDADTLRRTGPPLAGHNGPVRSLCLLAGARDHTILASAGNDGTIRLWDPRDATAGGQPFTGHDGWIWSLASIPGEDTWLLASAGADATIRLWHPDTGQVAVLAGHTDQVRAVAPVTAADGATLLASGGHDGTVRLWHPATGQPIHTVPLGIPVHALLQQPSGDHSRQRTDGGATVTVGLRTGILSLDLNRSMFPPRT
jgi:WD40 repeat protein